MIIKEIENLISEVDNVIVETKSEKSTDSNTDDEAAKKIAEDLVAANTPK